MKLPKDKVQRDNRKMSRSEFRETHFSGPEEERRQRRGQISSKAVRENKVKGMLNNVKKVEKSRKRNEQ